MGNIIGGGLGVGGVGGQVAGATGLNGLGGIGSTLGGGLNSLIDPILGGLGAVQPQSANILQPSTVEQANQLYGQTQSGLAQQQAFINALQAQHGIQNQADVYNQLAGVAAGNGPNPAQTMLANATAANTANQAALMASQRGSGANVGLMARQAAMQGGANQQQSVGQGAQMQAQQQLGALGTMGNIAGQQVGQQANAIGGYNQFAQGAQANTLNSIQGQNNANVAMQSNMNNNRTAMAQGMMQAKGNMISGITGAAGSAIGLAHGGEVHSPGPRSFVGKHLTGSSSIKMASGGDVTTEGPALDLISISPAAPTEKPSKMAKGGKVPAMLSPGEIYVPPSKAGKVAEKKESAKEAGKKVPGKASVKGDSLKNDTIPATLEEGGIVIPRSITGGKDAERKCADFVAAHFKKHRLK